MILNRSIDTVLSVIFWYMNDRPFLSDALYNRFFCFCILFMLSPSEMHTHKPAGAKTVHREYVFRDITRSRIKLKIVLFQNDAIKSLIPISLAL